MVHLDTDILYTISQFVPNKYPLKYINSASYNDPRLNVKFDRNVLIKACKDGHLDLVKWLLKIHPNVNNEYIFRIACEYGHLDIAKWLVEKYPNINVHASGEDAFISSCTMGHLELAQWLVEKYPNIDVYTNDNFAFVSASINEHIKVAEWLIEKYPNIIRMIDNELSYHYIYKYGSRYIVNWVANLIKK